MGPKKDPKIAILEKVLQYRGFVFREIQNGIRVDLENFGFQGDSVDFYVLRNNPQQLRARIRRPEPPSPTETERIAEMQKVLQSGISGAAVIETFHFFGQRGSAQIYYSHIKMVKGKQKEVFLKQKLAEKVYQQIQDIDAKTLRQGLDELGFPRSSPVRMALTRIFRNAIDVQDLIDVIADESKKITQPEDWKKVKDLKLGKKPSFLNGVVDLLWAEIVMLNRRDQQQ